MGKFKVEISVEVETDDYEKLYFIAQMFEMKLKESCDAEDSDWNVTKL